MTTVPNVADGQLIATSWGNTVANVVNGEVVRKDGGTMTGALVLPSSDPTGANQASRKGYVDGRIATRLPLDGGGLTGNLDMNNNLVISLGAPTADGHAARKSYVDTQVTGAKNYADSQANARVARGGDTMSGNLNMGGNTINNLRDPTVGQEAATFSWCNGRFELKSTSDYRLKERDGPILDAAARVIWLAGRGYRGRWSDDGDVEHDFLNAHDVAEVAPYAVTGDKDAVDDEGNVVAQTVRWATLVPLLVAALGDALDRLAALEAR